MDEPEIVDVVQPSPVKLNPEDEWDFPNVLDFPDKLLPLLDAEVINKYRIFIIEGGRGSSKTQTVGRLILHFCEILPKLRCMAAREQQNSIEDSVYTVLKDLIMKNSLKFEMTKTRIESGDTRSTIGFKGLREQGVVNVKGMEAVDIVWVDEAQSITKVTLDTLLPTIRKNNAKIFFTLNRFLRDDPVMTLVGRPDVLHIHIDYFENKHCTQALKNEAEECKKKNPKDYNHIWLGQPLDVAEDFLFNFARLAECKDLPTIGDLIKQQRILSIDFASGGGDLCVASVLKRISMTQWELEDQVAWDDPDTDSSVGKAIDIYGRYQPDVFIVDMGGLGYPMFISISKTIKTVIGFDGSKTDMCSPNSGNHRAEGYLLFSEWVNQGWLRIKSDYTIKQCETIRKKHKANGKIFIKSKEEQRKDGIESQDRSDSVAQGVFAAVKYLGKVVYTDTPIGQRIQRINKRKPM